MFSLHFISTLGDGTNDQMICFSCQQGLMMWQKDDNPWVEHARWSKHCNFVLLNMGKRFVKEICGEENTPKCTYEVDILFLVFS